MSEDHERRAEYLAANLRYLRQQRGVTQARLAAQSDVPRSTIANLETGAGNPTLSVLSRVALTLQVSIEELISAPRASCRKVPASALVTRQRGKGASITQLLPDPVPGMEIDRVVLAPGSTLTGVPHRPGTREYLYCAQGRITLVAGGDRVDLDRGDVAAFQGDQKHSYGNPGDVQAVGFSVVALVPLT